MSAWRFFSEFCSRWTLLAGTVDREPFLGRSLLFRPLQNFQGQPPGGQGPLPGPGGGCGRRRLARRGRHSAGRRRPDFGGSRRCRRILRKPSGASFRVGNAAKLREMSVLQSHNLVLNITERKPFLAVINLTQKSNTKQIYSSRADGPVISFLSCIKL